MSVCALGEESAVYKLILKPSHFLLNCAIAQPSDVDSITDLITPEALFCPRYVKLAKLIYLLLKLPFIYM